MIDTGQKPRWILSPRWILKKLTAQPVRFVIHTDPTDDHTNGDFVFFAAAVVVAHAGATDSMPRRTPSSATRSSRASNPGWAKR